MQWWYLMNRRFKCCSYSIIRCDISTLPLQPLNFISRLARLRTIYYHIQLIDFLDTMHIFLFDSQSIYHTLFSVLLIFFLSRVLLTFLISAFMTAFWYLRRGQFTNFMICSLTTARDDRDHFVLFDIYSAFHWQIRECHAALPRLISTFIFSPRSYSRISDYCISLAIFSGRWLASLSHLSFSRRFSPLNAR